MCRQKSCVITCSVLCADGLDGLPEPQSMRVENKMFYFDVGQNRRGIFMRVSEVSSVLCNGCCCCPQHVSLLLLGFCHSTVSAKNLFSGCSFIQISSTHHLVNALNYFDKTDREYSLALTRVNNVTLTFDFLISKFVCRLNLRCFTFT